MINDLTKIMNQISTMSFFDIIGFFGPAILFCISVLKLYKRQPYLIGYLIFSAGNIIINSILKTVIKQERPHSIGDEHYIGMQKYGMPSAHAQSVFYSMTYLYLTNGDSEILLVGMFIGALTLYQRWKYSQHTVEQLGVGVIVGVIIAFFAQFMTKQYIVTRTMNL
jgi:membrane-associated phospholipid phosphatase